VQGQNLKEIVLSGKITVNKQGVEDVVVKNESTNQTTTSTHEGSFNINCKLGDIIHFSSVTIETKRKKVTVLEYQNKNMIVEMTTRTIDLKEVVINNTSITAEKLRIIPENQKKYTPAERRLKTAGDFKPIHLLSILGGSLALDPIINKISGRTKKLKKELEIEKKERLLNRLKALYNDEFYTMNLKIAKVYVDAFRYFCIEHHFFVTYLTSGNKQLMELSMSELAVTFNNNSSSEE
jgi:hypothetical protein